jgi:beta-galactosidase
MNSARIDRRDVLKSAVAGTAALGLSPGASGMTMRTESVQLIGAGRGQDFDLGWRFHRGEGGSFEAPGLDDSTWRGIDLPHDWSIEDLPVKTASQSDRVRGPFDRDEPGGTATAFTHGGEGWYRKRFRLAGPAPAQVGLEFDGVYMNAQVWCNGVAVGSRHNGYTPFSCDLTPHLSASGDNVIAVRVRSLGKNSRWYAGAGINRHVRLNVHAEAPRIARWGVNAATQRISGGTATVAIESRIEAPGEGLTLHTRLLDALGRAVWQASAAAAASVAQVATIANAALWSPESPHLYTIETMLQRGSAVLDTVRTPFGARIVTFDRDAGMAVNGKPTKLRGGCIHHDNGLLGAASFDAAEYRKVALLKARGYNALRPSHNLFSPAFLDACDRLGMMVIGETFDMWLDHKIGPGDFSDFFEADWHTDLDAIVLSARHHPAIIMWSIGNEVPGRNGAEGVEMQWKMAQRTHRLDPTRPVTAAINGFAGHEITLASGQKERTSTAFLDVIGYNYKLADYEADRGRFPTRLFFGTESFPKDVFAIWALTERTPWLIGDFVWTAMDYLGEAGIGGSSLVSAKSKPGQPSFAGWPWVNAFCGDIDLIGAQKAPSLARDVVWGLSTLEMTVQRPAPDGKRDEPHIWGWHDELESWTWPEAARPMTVRLYTSAERLELQLDGHTVGTRDREGKPGVEEFTVPYAPGVLEAVAWRGPRVVARRRLETVGAPAGLRLRVEKPVAGRSPGSARGDVSFVMIDVVDAQGRRVPDAAIALSAEVKGAGELVGFGSASPFATGSYQSGHAATWQGRALAVVRGKGAPGRAGLSVSGTGLAPAMATLKLG